MHHLHTFLLRLAYLAASLHTRFVYLQHRQRETSRNPTALYLCEDLKQTCAPANTGITENSNRLFPVSIRVRKQAPAAVKCTYWAQEEQHKNTICHPRLSLSPCFLTEREKKGRRHRGSALRNSFYCHGGWRLHKSNQWPSFKNPTP